MDYNVDLAREAFDLPRSCENIGPSPRCYPTASVLVSSRHTLDRSFDPGESSCEILATEALQFRDCLREFHAVGLLLPAV